VLALPARSLIYQSPVIHDCLESFWTLARLWFSSSALLSAPFLGFCWWGFLQPDNQRKAQKHRKH
jgi:hypothetical protein